MSRLSSIYRAISQLLRLPMAGPVFKLYAPRRRWERRDPYKRGPLRVLIVNLMPSLGDTIANMVLAEVLADALPGVEITWLADAAMAGIIARHPDVQKVLVVTTPASFLRSIPTAKMYFRLYWLMRTMYRADLKEPFDVALVPRGGVDPALSAHAVWILNPLRSIGYSHLVEPKEVDHNFSDQLLTDVVMRTEDFHEVMRGLRLLEIVDLVKDATARWNINMPIRGIRAIADSIDVPSVLERVGVPIGKPYIVLAPGAGVPNRMWPAAKFRALCARVLEETSYFVVLTGTAAEAATTAGIVPGYEGRVFDIAGKLSLAELMGVVSGAAAFVGNDSGAGHIAGPLGVSVVTLNVQPSGSDPFHMNAPEHFRPAGPRVTVLQPNGFLAPCRVRCESKSVHCLDQISVDRVWSALKDAMAEASVP